MICETTGGRFLLGFADHNPALVRFASVWPNSEDEAGGTDPISDIILKFQFTYHPWSAAIQLSEHPAMHNWENAAKIAAISSFAAKIEICAALLLICRQPSETTLFIGPRSDRSLPMSLTD